MKSRIRNYSFKITKISGALLKTVKCILVKKCATIQIKLPKRKAKRLNYAKFVLCFSESCTHCAGLPTPNKYNNSFIPFYRSHHWKIFIVIVGLSINTLMSNTNNVIIRWSDNLFILVMIYQFNLINLICIKRVQSRTILQYTKCTCWTLPR